MPPSTPFTKIWKLRNNGTANWPYGTQLVWVDGHQLGHKSSFTLEQIPLCGLAVGAEFDVIIGFTAPSKPGRYVSYWRLQCPSLRKFGQRVGVDFEVKDNGCSSFYNLNLNLPPKNNTQNTGKANAGIYINADPVSEVGSTEATKKNTSNNDVTGNNEGFVKYDSVDQTLVADALANVNHNCKVSYENSAEEECLNELKEMGFNQVELNREVLRCNKYDLDLTIEDLCGFGQWDALLSELHKLAKFNYLGQFSHPNLVKLVGYCCEDTHRLLVYEYMAYGSLERHLFRSGCRQQTGPNECPVCIGSIDGSSIFPIYGGETSYTNERDEVYFQFMVVAAARPIAPPAAVNKYTLCVECFRNSCPIDLDI